MLKLALFFDKDQTRFNGDYGRSQALTKWKINTHIVVSKWFKGVENLLAHFPAEFATNCRKDILTRPRFGTYA